MTNKLDALHLATRLPGGEEDRVAQAANSHGSTRLRFRGLLLRRRCDSCGTRISILGEEIDKVFMRCPECLREYVFFERPE